MKIIQVSNDTYEVSTHGGLRRIMVTGARVVVQRSGRVGGFVQRLVGFVEATSTRFAATIRWLTDREILKFLPHVRVEQGIGERLLGQVMRRLGVRQTLRVLTGLAGDPTLLAT